MGKNSDIESISNSISKTILHKIVIENTNKPESINKMTNEEVEYREQSLKKIDKRKLNNKDKKVLREKVIRKINNQLKLKYSDVKVSEDVIVKVVDKELESFFEIEISK